MLSIHTLHLFTWLAFQVRKPSKAGSDEAAAKTLFDRSEEFIGGARFELPPDASAYVVPQAKKQK